MTLWVVRAGKYGEREQLALSEKLVVIGWQELSDLSPVSGDRKALAMLLRDTYPDDKPKTVLNWESQIWPFISSDPKADRIKIGDTVGLPLKKRPTIAIGRVIGDYVYRPDLPGDAKHTRQVEWLGEIARAELDPQLRFSFGGAMTIFRITKGDAEQTVLRLVGKGGIRQQSSQVVKDSQIPLDPTIATDARARIDISETAQDEIRAYISRRFKGHGLSRLVAAVLEAQGYTVTMAPEGADRGVDIIAGRGALGFEAPRLVVQVKSGDSAVDAATVQQLQGAMAMTKAQHGLFVAWGGYRGSLNWSSTLTQHFDMRLWTDVDLIEAIESCYERLPPDIQAELPLQRVWTLVNDEEE